MPDLFENPMGLDGFEFVELCLKNIPGQRAGPVVIETARRYVITSYSIHYTKLYDGLLKCLTRTPVPR